MLHRVDQEYKYEIASLMKNIEDVGSSKLYEPFHKLPPLDVRDDPHGVVRDALRKQRQMRRDTLCAVQARQKDIDKRKSALTSRMHEQEIILRNAKQQLGDQVISPQMMS